MFVVTWQAGYVAVVEEAYLGHPGQLAGPRVSDERDVQTIHLLATHTRVNMAL